MRKAAGRLTMSTTSTTIASATMLTIPNTTFISIARFPGSTSSAPMIQIKAIAKTLRMVSLVLASCSSKTSVIWNLEVEKWECVSGVKTCPNRRQVGLTPRRSPLER